MVWPWHKAESNTRDSLLTEVTLAIARVMGPSAGTAHAPIEPAALLGADLGLSSIAVARLAGLLQKRFAQRPLRFHRLFVKPDGTMLQDIRVSDLVAFLEHHLREDEP